MGQGINRVYPQLWIANITAARTEPMDKFDAVVTVCQDSIADHIPSDTEYHFFEMADGAAGGYGGRSDYEFFEDAARQILDHLEAGDTILVHCHMGQSRSASTSIAALATIEGTTYHEMRERIEEERPQIHPDGLLEDHAMRFIEERVESVNHTPFVEEQ